MNNKSSIWRIKRSRRDDCINSQSRPLFLKFSNNYSVLMLHMLSLFIIW